MTFRVLIGRLERLQRLADIVCTGQQSEKVGDAIAELETYDPDAPVASELLSALRERLLNAPDLLEEPRSHGWAHPN